MNNIEESLTDAGFVKKSSTAWLKDCVWVELNECKVIPPIHVGTKFPAEFPSEILCKSPEHALKLALVVIDCAI